MDRMKFLDALVKSQKSMLAMSHAMQSHDNRNGLAAPYSTFEKLLMGQIELGIAVQTGTDDEVQAKLSAVAPVLLDFTAAFTAYATSDPDFIEEKLTEYAGPLPEPKYAGGFGSDPISR